MEKKKGTQNSFSRKKHKSTVVMRAASSVVDLRSYIVQSKHINIICNNGLIIRKRKKRRCFVRVFKSGGEGVGGVVI